MSGPVGHQRSGKGGRANIEGGDLRMSQWDCSEKAEKLDTTNFESGGKTQATFGPTTLEWSLRGPWDASTNADDDPPGLYVRDDLGQATLYTSVSDNVFYSIPQSLVLSSACSAEVKGLVNFNCSCESNGSGWATPTGSV